MAVRDKKMNRKKGYVTVATGNEKYYKMAADLYLSYKVRGKGKCPFAIICDRENEYTKVFDDVILVQEYTRSTVDKLLMKYSPYDETIFMDTDILVLDDIDNLWEVFKDEDDVSVFGNTLPLDSQNGWFTYEGSGKYKSQIKYLISMNGGIYYFRKGEKADRVIQQAFDLIEDYSSIDFKYFSQPQDEPLMAMSMVLNECKPCTTHYDMIILPACDKKVTTDYLGNVYEGKMKSPAKFIHFSARRTELFLYNYLNEINHQDESWKNKYNYRSMWKKYMPEDVKFRTYHICGSILRKMGLNSFVDNLKKKIRSKG